MTLRDCIDERLRAAMQDGTLERILRRWNIWNDDQPELHRQVLAREPIPPTVGLDTAPSVTTMSGAEAARRYLPSLLQASMITIVLSCLSMALAVVLGVLIATGRVYGSRAVRLSSAAT